jgi:hypothetical protein
VRPSQGRFSFMGGKTLRHAKWDGAREASCRE